MAFNEGSYSVTNAFQSIFWVKYHIQQNIRGGKLSRLEYAHRKTFAVAAPFIMNAYCQ